MTVPFRAMVPMAFAVVAAVDHPALAQAIRFVDDDAAPGGNGSTWATAFDSLQDAINIAGVDDRIFVAAGTYVPELETTPGDPESRSFVIAKNRITILGGFNPAENPSDPADRRPREFPSILDGELDATSPGALRSYHVVWFREEDTSLSRLSGFVIQNGRATYGLDEHSQGGGILCNNAQALVDGCIIRFNEALQGGGAATRHVVNLGQSTKLHLVNCVIEANAAVNGGAIMEFLSTVQPLYSRLENCVVRSNLASSKGGGYYAIGKSLLLQPRLKNCTFVANSAGLHGGGLVYDALPGAPIHNCIFRGNSDSSGSGTEQAQLAAPSGGVATGLDVQHSCIEGLTVYAGNGNIGADPLFVDASAGNLRLKPASPAIDAGLSASVPADLLDVDDDLDQLEPTPDPDLRTRILSGVVDIGAYEHAEDCSDVVGGDQIIGFADLLAVLANWGPCPTPPADCPADLDDDDQVGFNDLLAILANWGVCEGSGSQVYPPESIADCMAKVGTDPVKLAACIEAMILAGTP